MSRWPQRCVGLLVVGLLTSGRGVTAETLDWSFGDGPQGWRAGTAPVEFFLGAASDRITREVWTSDGALLVVGAPVERVFIDSTGLLRRGQAQQEWLLAPELNQAADGFTRIRVEMRSRAGRATYWQVQWLSDGGRQAFLDLRRRRQALVLPDSVAAMAQAYREGRLARWVLDRFVRGWERGEGRAYIEAANRLDEEEAYLETLIQTGEVRIPGGDEGWRKVILELQSQSGWQGQVLGFGIRVSEEPRLWHLPSEDEKDATFVLVRKVSLFKGQ